MAVNPLDDVAISAHDAQQTPLGTTVAQPLNLLQRTSYLRSTPGSSYLYSSGTLPTKASTAKADFNASLLR